MILLPRAVRVYFATAPVDLRRSFDGLSNEVRAVLGSDPLNGHVFVFLNRSSPRTPDQYFVENRIKFDHLRRFVHSK